MASASLTVLLPDRLPDDPPPEDRLPEVEELPDELAPDWREPRLPLTASR